MTHRDLETVVYATGTPNVVAELTETDADIAPYVPSGRFLFRAPFGSWSTRVFDALRMCPAMSLETPELPR